MAVVCPAQRSNSGATVELRCETGTSGGAAWRSYSVVDTGAPGLLTAFDGLLLAFSVAFQFSVSSAVVARIPTSEALHLLPLVPLPFSPDIVVSLTAVALLLVLLVRILRGATAVRAETVTAISGVGLQLSRTTWRGAADTRLLDVGTLDALVVHEGFHRHAAVYYLAAVLRDEASVVVLFDATLPRLPVLQEALAGLRGVLYDEPDTGRTLAAIADDEAPARRR